MRRKDREVKDFDIIRQIIDECTVIRIGLCDEDMYPWMLLWLTSLLWAKQILNF